MLIITGIVRLGQGEDINFYPYIQVLISLLIFLLTLNCSQRENLPAFSVL